MPPGLRHLLLVLPLLAAACAHVDPDREVLRSLDFEGNESISAGAIEERLALTETPFWPWADPRYFDEGTMSGDRRRLQRFYRASGFYEARVRTRLEREDGEAHVTFLIDEGPATRVQRIEVRGLEALPEEDRQAILRRRLPLAVGDRISEEGWDQLRAELAQRLRNRGYGAAQVAGTVHVDVDARAAVIEARVEPGDRQHFGEVVIAGAVDVPRQTILETVRSSIPDGSRYSDERLIEAQSELMAMGVFSGVRVEPGPVDPATGAVPVVVAVREAAFQTLRLGIGAGVDPASISARATGNYTHRNFLGGLRTLRFENEVGWAILRAGTRVLEHGPIGSSTVDFTQPDLVRRIDLNVRVGYEHDIDLAYRFDAVKGRVGFPIRLHRSLVFTPSWNVQRIWLTENEGIATTASGENCQLEDGDCVLVFLEERLAWDRRDDPLNTRSGWYASLALQQGRSWLGSQSSYDRVLGEARWYQPLPAGWVLALRLEAGVLEPTGDQRSPITERFYAGGSNSVRGFGYNRLSPQQRRSSADTEGTLSERDTVPVGGDALLEGTVELRIPLAGPLGMALFTDAGNVTVLAEETGELLRPNVAVGAGVRYATPFGPVRLDVGWLAVRNLPCVVDGGTCTEARVETSPIAVHFSIGEAF